MAQSVQGRHKKRVGSEAGNRHIIFWFHHDFIQVLKEIHQIMTTLFWQQGFIFIHAPTSTKNYAWPRNGKHV